jgi:hypothetical protein
MADIRLRAVISAKIRGGKNPSNALEPNVAVDAKPCDYVNTTTLPCMD